MALNFRLIVLIGTMLRLVPFGGLNSLRHVSGIEQPDTICVILDHGCDASAQVRVVRVRSCSVAHYFNLNL